MRVFERIDRDIPLDEDERQLLDSVRRLCAEAIAPRAAGHDETGAFPWDNVRDIARLGLNTMFIPVEFGGSGLSYTAYLACAREIAEACAATGIVWSTNFHATSPLVDFASDTQKRRWLPMIAEGGLAAIALTEPGAGSDATAMRTRFEPDGDAIVVDGTKTFITNGDIADFVVLFGKWGPLGQGREALSIVVVERGTPGFAVDRLEKKMGTRASSTAQLSFSGCRIPAANLLRTPGSARQMMLDFLDKSRPSVAAHALGIARAAFKDAVAYVNQRQQFGRRIVDFQGIQFLLADLAAELALVETWLWTLAARIERGERGLGVEASILKLRATDLAMRMTTEAVQLHGGYGYTQDYRVERLMRDAKITQIWEGTNQIHRQMIGRDLVDRQGRPA